MFAAKMDSPSTSQDSQLAAAFDDEFAAWEGGDADLDPNDTAEHDGMEGQLEEKDQVPWVYCNICLVCMHDHQHR